MIYDYKYFLGVQFKLLWVICGFNSNCCWFLWCGLALNLMLIFPQLLIC